MPLAPPPSFERFDDWAEDIFASLGSGTGATINPSRRDRRGWDYLVEWDLPPVPSMPSDRQRLGRTARIQVKSSRQNKPVAKLKLSNAKRFADAVEPCFIVLFWFDKANGAVHIYARHFDRDLVYRTLKRVREAHRDGDTELNRLNMLFPMSDEDLHTDDLIPWLRDRCLADPQLYSAEKGKVVESVGYEEGGLVGSMKFPLSRAKALVEHAVGLNRTFNPDWLELREARFGIPSNTPLLAGKPTHFNLRVKPKPAVLSFISEDGEEVRFPGEFRAFTLPGVDAPDLWASFTCPHITGRLHRDSRFDINYRLNGSDREDARYLAKLTTLFRLLSTGIARARLQIADDSYETTTISEANHTIDTDFFGWAEQMLELLLSVARRFDKPQVSLGDMAESGDEIERFAMCVSEGTATLKTTFTKVEDCPPQIRSLMGFAYLELGDSVFAAFYRQPILSQDLDKTELTAEFSAPIMLDNWVKKGSLRSLLPMIRKRFKDLLAKSGRGVVTVNGGDLISGIREAKELAITS